MSQDKYITTTEDIITNATSPQVPNGPGGDSRHHRRFVLRPDGDENYRMILFSSFLATSLSYRIFFPRCKLPPLSLSLPHLSLPVSRSPSPSHLSSSWQRRRAGLLTAIISHFDRQLLENKLSLAACSIHILPISNKFHKFWWFVMFCRIMARICKKQY